MKKKIPMITPELRQIWLMVAAGCTVKEIARVLGVGNRTADFRLQVLYYNLGIKPRDRHRGIVLATRLAIKHGLIVLSSLCDIGSIHTYYVPSKKAA